MSSRKSGVKNIHPSVNHGDETGSKWSRFSPTLKRSARSFTPPTPLRAWTWVWGKLSKTGATSPVTMRRPSCSIWPCVTPLKSGPCLAERGNRRWTSSPSCSRTAFHLQYIEDGKEEKRSLTRKTGHYPLHGYHFSQSQRLLPLHGPSRFWGAVWF